MRTDFKFSNLLGTVYCRGNLVFTPDGNSLLSPVGNRVSCFDLVYNKSFTFEYSHRKNISQIALSPNGKLLLSVDEDGRAILVNFRRRIVMHHFNFSGGLGHLAFSPTGTYIAAAIGRKLEVWRTPKASEEREFAPFIKHREYAGHYDQVTIIQWSGDERFFLTGGKDQIVRMWSLDPEQLFKPTVLSGHKEAIIGAYFADKQETIYSVSRDGALFLWKYREKGQPQSDASDEEDDLMDLDLPERWYTKEKHFFEHQNAKVTCCTFHEPTGLLIVGFSSGIFGIYELPSFNMIHTLSISQNDIDFVTVNQTGEWFAFGAAKLGQLLVWEWQSESYVLKQQGHYDAINALCYSPDGQRIITTADDGKVKVWDVKSGFCTVTFTEHSSGVTACEFAKRGNVLFTASLDGSVRAWDLIRYRNFRTYTAPERLQFSCVAIDPSGEVVCAGSLDSFDIHLWSVQTGQLLDRLTAHEGPVSSLSFAPHGDVLLSGSWDHTVRMWNIFSRSQSSEPLQLQAEILAVTFRPDAKQVAVSTLDGNLTFWDTSMAEQTSEVAGKRDVSGGRLASSRQTAAHMAGTKHYSTIRYAADGTCVLAGGRSKYICLYDVVSGALLRKFPVSTNLSLDGTQEFLNSKLLTDAGPLALINMNDNNVDDAFLPGASRGDLSSRRVKPEIRVQSLSFSPTSSSFAIASTEGLLIYSLEKTALFDPVDLDIDITPSTTLSTLSRGDYLRALIMAFRLNLASLITRVYYAVPVDSVTLLVRELPVLYIPRLLRFVATASEEGPHLEFGLRWTESILRSHGRWIRENKGDVGSELRLILRAVARVRSEIERLADENTFTLDYLLQKPQEAREEEDTAEVPDPKQLSNGDVKDEMQVVVNGTENGGEVDIESAEEEEWEGFDD